MAEGAPLQVLFVCIGNSCRSQMAEGFARALGAGRLAAHSAGSRPSGQVNPTAVRLMAERGIDISGQASKGLGELPPGAAWDCVVTMGCGDACPALPARHRLDWDLPDPIGMEDAPFRRVRDEIERLVRGLLAGETGFRGEGAEGNRPSGGPRRGAQGGRVRTGGRR
jgi:protein-tyrosine-phosphatase